MRHHRGRSTFYGRRITKKKLQGYLYYILMIHSTFYPNESIFLIIIILFICKLFGYINNLLAFLHLFFFLSERRCMFKIWIQSLSTAYGLFKRLTGRDLNFLLFFPDEIMQLETCPPRAADIAPDLRKQFAFLSGDGFMFLYSLCLDLCLFSVTLFTSDYMFSGIFLILTGRVYIFMVYMNLFSLNS